MKQIRVIAESKNKLVLDEAAEKGDWIDLAQINSVDTGLVEKALAAGADKVYQEKLRAAKSPAPLSLLTVKPILFSAHDILEE